MNYLYKFLLSEISIRLKTLESKNKSLTEDVASLINKNENLVSDRDIKKKIIERMQNHISSLENVCNIILLVLLIISNLNLFFRKLNRTHNYFKNKIIIMNHLISSKYVYNVLCFLFD